MVIGLVDEKIRMEGFGFVGVLRVFLGGGGLDEGV